MPHHLRFGRSGHPRWRVRRWPFLPPHHAQTLTAWGQLNFRPYPWRKAKDPFHLLLAEMLLRRTHATHASRLWERLITAYPTPEALANAPIPELERLLRPAGMAHRRALALRQTARYLVDHHKDRVPASPKDLIKIPNVGRYAAHAVASFGFGLPFPVADVNVMRVLGRFVGSDEPVHYKIPGHIWRRAGRSAPFHDVATFNYALLDLAALVCRPGRPDCKNCPLSTGCASARR